MPMHGGTAFNGRGQVVAQGGTKRRFISRLNRDGVQDGRRVLVCDGGKQLAERLDFGFDLGATAERFLQRRTCGSGRCFRRAQRFRRCVGGATRLASTRSFAAASVGFGVRPARRGGGLGIERAALPFKFRLLLDDLVALTYRFGDLPIQCAAPGLLIGQHPHVL